MIKPLTNKQAEETLAAYLRGGRLPHALLMEGRDVDHRGRFALKAAQGALCSAEPELRPCGVCRDCIKAEKRIHPDIHVYGGEGGARSFHIDTVREIRQQAYVQPGEAEAKALILRDVQELSVQAQNALLKIIEEPPRDVYFILTCDNKAALLETILSRVAVVALDGSSGLEEAGDDADDPAEDILYNLCAGSELEALGALTAYERDRAGLAALLERMGGLLSSAMLRPGGHERMDSIVDKISRWRLLQILAITEDMAAAANQNAGGMLLVTALSAGIRAVLAEG